MVYVTQLFKLKNSGYKYNRRTPNLYCIYYYVFYISKKTSSFHNTPAFQQQINNFKMNPLRALVSYAGFATSYANATPEQLMNGFRLISSKSNLYISNFGHYNRNQDERLEFSGSTTISAGGFNFPLQGHYGLIVTWVPYGHKVSVGITVSPSIFNKQDLESFKSQVVKYLS
ncbi:hypothetical protein [Photobacterium sanguinicancri]|uniref:Beta-lactamase-related domain-containing protein n=1 Tax=Photobacterium sanguinicancri TaxID=875932 RepID=A0AAW7Y5U8_9GAMM|nr:hypothetical protein [Photobacterium sanguinicancri]MDO6543998.1 hypothetical protein [Photobacterium sanguinicancri]